MTHVHSGGMCGGNSICGEQSGNLTDDADKSDCVDCVVALRDYLRKNPEYVYADEIKRACVNLNLEL